MVNLMWERHRAPVNSDARTDQTPKKWFTVVGFWPDSRQRFLEAVLAPTGKAAEQAMGDKYPGLTVTGVITGLKRACDNEIYVKTY